MRIVIYGPKASGKSTIGKSIAKFLNLPFCETDELIELTYYKLTGKNYNCRQIYLNEGKDFFSNLETEVVNQIADLDWCLIITGGSLLINPENRSKLRKKSILIYFTADKEVLWERISNLGYPPWLDLKNPKESFYEELKRREDILLPYADIIVDTTFGSVEELTSQVIEKLSEELAIRTSSPNTFGDLVRVTTFGESHGPAIGAVIDGIPPGIQISEDDIQKELDRRKPGQSSITTRRKESDKVHILSGIFEGKTTGSPIALLIYNDDPKSHHYDNIKDVFRPGHADYTFFMKFGIRDYRGGGRASGRETVARVAAGAIAKKILEKKGVKILAYSVEIGGVSWSGKGNYRTIETNPVRCPDADSARRMEEKIIEARKEGDSVGGIVQIEIHGIPPGLGDPVFGKLSSRLASAVMSIGAVKGIEFGDGFSLALLKGSEANDAMANGKFLSNHSGGLLGGISTGEPIVMRVVVKPTSSIAKPQKTINTDFKNVEIRVHGRHDPCIVPRAIPVMESMIALTIIDAWAKQSKLNPQWAEKWGSPFE